VGRHVEGALGHRWGGSVLAYAFRFPGLYQLVLDLETRLDDQRPSRVQLVSLAPHGPKHMRRRDRAQGRYVEEALVQLFSALLSAVQAPPASAHMPHALNSLGHDSRIHEFS